jgi:hypothetical protein
MIFARNNLFIVAILRIVAIPKTNFPTERQACTTTAAAYLFYMAFPIFFAAFRSALPFGQAFIVGH